MIPNRGPIAPISANTSCSVTNNSFGPLREISPYGIPFAIPFATAAGITAIPAIRAIVVSATTITIEFFFRFSYLLR